MLSAGAARIVCSGLADARETGRYTLYIVHCSRVSNACVISTWHRPVTKSRVVNRELFANEPTQFHKLALDGELN